VPRMRSAYAEVSTSMASLSYFDLRALRMEEPGAPPIGAKATAQSTCTAPVSKGAAAD
jgi:hypothetical protein